MASQPQHALAQDGIRSTSNNIRCKFKTVWVSILSAMALPFTVKVFVATGDPDGLRVIEMGGWNGRGLIFPRNRFSDVKDYEPLQNAGVYILWGSGLSRLPEVYIGEGSKLVSRLESHVKGMAFWSHCVAFTSTDKMLTKAHVQYLEWALLSRADEINRCQLENSVSPKEPFLPAMDKADTNIFLNNMLLCLPIIGVSFFDEAKSGPTHPLPVRGLEVFLKASKIGISARGVCRTGKRIKVFAGSEARKDEVQSIDPSVSKMRKTLVDTGALEDAGSMFLFAQDHEFLSPSMAGGVVLGRSCNGWKKWKDSRGRELGEILKAN